MAGPPKMGHVLRKALLMAGLPPFAYDPAKKSSAITLSGTYNNIATNGASATYRSALSLQPMLVGWVYKMTIVAVNDAQIPIIAIGNASANVDSRFGVVDANSVGLASGFVWRGASNLGAGPTYGTLGDIVRAKLVNSTDIAFSVNGGAYSTPIAHGLTGTLYAGVTLYGLNDQVSAVWE